MPAVDRWVIQQAVRLLAHADPALRLEVNVSGESMADDELTQRARVPSWRRPASTPRA